MSNQAEKGEWPSETIPSGWSWLDFKSAWTDCTDSKKKVKQREYHDVGALPVIDQGEGLIGGHTNDLSMKNSVELPCIIFGDHTRAVKFVDFEFAQGADGVKVLKPGSQFDPQFAFQAMRCIELPNKGYSRHFKFLKSSNFPVPPLPEQRRIVAKLDRLSERSANARDHLTRVTALAARAKQAILVSKVHSFNKGEATPVSFAEVITQAQNGLSKRRGDEGSETLVLRLADLSDGQFYGRDGRSIRMTDEERKKYLLQRGDLVCIRVNGSEKLVGRMLEWTEEAPWCFCDHFIRFRIDESIALPKFVSLFFATDEVRREIEGSFVSSAGQKTVSQKTLGKITLPLPPIERQAAIVRFVEVAFDRIDRLTEEASRASHLLDRLDESLLAKAFQGELVPQDPDDEPAEALLERIRAAKAAAPKAKRARRKKTA